MPNKPEDRLRFKAAVNNIVNKYHPWIQDNRHLNSVLAATDAKLDQIIHFLDPMDFHIFLMQRKHKVSEGCSVAAMTISSRDDDTDLTYQRQIVFSRAMVTNHTITHEFFHFLTHPAFGRALPPKVVEGFTEYFTHKIIGGRGTAAAAAAAVGDDGVAHASGYDDLSQGVDTARRFLKQMVFPTITADRNAAPLQLGRHRNPHFVPDETRGVSFKNFTKRAYFKGDPQMIQFIKEQAVW